MTVLRIFAGKSNAAAMLRYKFNLQMGDEDLES